MTRAMTTTTPTGLAWAPRRKPRGAEAQKGPRHDVLAASRWRSSWVPSHVIILRNVLIIISLINLLNLQLYKYKIIRRARIPRRRRLVPHPS